MKARNKAHRNKFKIRKVAKIKRKLYKIIAAEHRETFRKCYYHFIEHGYTAL